ncbi:MAG: hypothetical protein DRJ64_04965 [Thermoprotei archaeon]|nr:MAG: hypothetical protein DRJ64_04965 [Thermoprotei archaeon]
MKKLSGGESHIVRYILQYNRLNQDKTGLIKGLSLSKLFSNMPSGTTSRQFKRLVNKLIKKEVIEVGKDGIVSFKTKEDGTDRS